MQTPDDRFRTFDLVEIALDLPPGDRAPFLRREARGDKELERRALEMLREAEASDAAPSQAPTQPLRLVTSTATAELLKRLGDSAPFDDARYEVRELLGSGGMGKVLRVEDKYLKRTLAMKLPHAGAPTNAGEHQSASMQLGRFLEEAQVTSQLDHPGVVPVHDLGLDKTGQVYFLMRRVLGENARSVFAKVREHRDGWTTSRALEIVLKVCDTMAYAHQKGVLHRDLKPDNIRVGAFGEVYVMDWGLAKIGDQEDRHDLRLPPAPAIASDRKVDAESDPGSSLVTMDGRVIGTVFYMSPEQALSQALDHRTDIYAIGATMYELLAGKPPYHDPNSWPADILERVRRTPPARIEELVSGTPAELVAIVEKAMARDPERRYASVTELAADVRAFLDQRVVLAHRTGALVELQMWMRRNRLAATASGIAVVLGITLLAGSWWMQQKNAALTHALVAKVHDFDLLAAVPKYQQVVQHEQKLYPAWPHRILDHEKWLAEECAPLLDQRAEIERTIERRRPGLARVDNGSDQFLDTTLQQLLGDLEGLDKKQRASVEQRLHWAKSISTLSLANPKAPVTWKDVREQIRASPRYQGADIALSDEDIFDLVPLGANAKGYFEFYHLRSAWDGTSDPADIPMPGRRSDGSIEVTEATGIVFVLLPGGTFKMGSQQGNASKPNYDTQHVFDEVLHEVTLAPFFLAIHEVTQGQVLRVSHEVGNPSRHHPPMDAEVGRLVTLAHPVETVDWHTAHLLLTRLGLVLPTEAQWEYACRAGTTSPWAVQSPEDLAHIANIADKTFAARKPDVIVEGWSDGHYVHAPVGSFRPNGFGIHDMHGNVSEWCQDWNGAFSYGTERAGDGLQSVTGSLRILRGGSFYHRAKYARSAARSSGNPSDRDAIIGFRAARQLKP